MRLEAGRALVALVIVACAATGTHAEVSADSSPVSTRGALLLDRRENATEEVAASFIWLGAALRAGDPARARGWLAHGFSGDRLPGDQKAAEEVHPGFRRAALATGERLDAERWTDAFCAWGGGLARLEDMAFDVRESDPKVDGEESRALVRLRAEGVTPEGGRVALSAELDAAVRFEDSRWKVASFKVTSGDLLTCARPPFEEVSVAAGIANVTRAFATADDFDWNWQGACAIDIDGDGWMDLFVPSRPVNHLFRNRGDGTFEDVAAAWGVQLPAGGTGVLALDYDNDGRTDLFVCFAEKPIRLFHNDGTKFTEVSHRAGVDRVVSGASAVAADYDGDGFLDVFVACYKPEKEIGPNSWHAVSNGGPSLLFHNRGDGTFEEVAARAGVAQPHFSFAAAWADYDEDGKPDLVVANDYGDKTLYHNLGGGKFEEVAARLGVADTGNGMGVDWGDADGDGHLDLFTANMTSVVGDRVMQQLVSGTPAGDTARVMDLLRGNGLFLWDGKAFRDVRREAGIADGGWAWGGGFVDVDGDGALDLFVANGMVTGRDPRDTDSIYWTHVANSSLPVPRAVREVPSSQVYVERHHGQVLRSGWSFAGRQRDRLFVNRGGAHFVDVSAVSGCDGAQDGRAVVFADFDNDGRPDLFVHEIQGNRHRLYRNRSPGPAAFTSLALTGVKGNRDAVGARVRATLAGPTGRRTLLRHVAAGSGYASSSDRRVLIPVPAGEKLEQVEVLWPGGAVQQLGALASGFFTLREGEPPKPRALEPAVLGGAGELPSSAGGILDGGDACPEPAAAWIPTWTGGPVRLAGRWTILTFLESSDKAEIEALEKLPDAIGGVGLLARPGPPDLRARAPLAVAQERFLHQVFGRAERRFPVALLVDPYGQVFARRSGPGCTAALAKLVNPK